MPPGSRFQWSQAPRRRRRRTNGRIPVHPPRHRRRSQPVLGLRMGTARSNRGQRSRQRSPLKRPQCDGLDKAERRSRRRDDSPPPEPRSFSAKRAKDLANRRCNKPEGTCAVALRAIMKRPGRECFPGPRNRPAKSWHRCPPRFQTSSSCALMNPSAEPIRRPEEPDLRRKRGELRTVALVPRRFQVRPPNLPKGRGTLRTASRAQALRTDSHRRLRCPFGACLRAHRLQ